MSATQPAPKTHCDCGWVFPRKLHLDLAVPDPTAEPAVPQAATIRLECPQCNRSWILRCPLSYVEHSLSA